MINARLKDGQWPLSCVLLSTEESKLLWHSVACSEIIKFALCGLKRWVKWERPDISLYPYFFYTLYIPSPQERSPERLLITARCFNFFNCNITLLYFIGKTTSQSISKYWWVVPDFYEMISSLYWHLLQMHETSLTQDRSRLLSSL